MTTTQSRIRPGNLLAEGARFPWGVVLALAAGAMWTVTAELLPAGLLLNIGTSLDVPSGTVGYLVTAWGIAIAVLCLPLARAARGVDPRRLLVVSLAATGVATVATALSPSFEVLVLVRMIAAAAHGLFWSQVVVVGTAAAGARHATRATAVIVAGPTVAGVSSIPAATALGEAVGWRTSFAVIGLLTVVSAAAVAAALPRGAQRLSAGPRRDSRERADRPPRDASAAPVTAVAVLGALLLVAHFVAFTFVAPALNGRGRQIEPSIALLVFGAAGIIGVAIAPQFSDRLPRAALPITGWALAASLLAFGLATSEPAVFLAMGLWGVVLGALPVVFQTRLFALASPSFRPMAGAVMVVALNLGIALGAGLGSGLEHLLGVDALALVGAGLAVAVALVTALWRQHEPDAARPAVLPEVPAGPEVQAR
jgi:predicted MFS family arabinose efflux permease